MNINFEMLEESIPLTNLTSLVIKSKSIFSKITEDIYDYNELSYLRIFDNKYNQLKQDELIIITDILGYDINSASTLKMIYADMESQINESPEVKSKFEELLSNVISLINKEIIDFDIDLDISEITLSGIFKISGMKIATEGNTIFERVLDIFRVFKYLKKKKLIIFLNLGTYLSKEQLKTLEEDSILENINVLLIDNYKFDGLSKQLVLDEDFELFIEADVFRKKYAE